MSCNIVSLHGSIRCFLIALPKETGAESGISMRIIVAFGSRGRLVLYLGGVS